MSEFSRPEISEISKQETVEYPEIAELEQPIKSIFANISGEISKGSYPLVIGMDASGRIPALVIQDAMEQIYKEKGFKAPELFFCAGFRQESKKETNNKKRQELQEKLGQFVQQRQIDLTGYKKILIVEDAVGKGGSIGPVVTTLMGMKFAVDVVAIGYVQPPKDLKALVKTEIESLRVGVIVGAEGNPKIYNTPYLAGVIKHPADIFATGFGASVKRKAASLESKPFKTRKEKKTLKNINRFSDNDLEGFFRNIQKEGINVARKDAHLVASHVAEDFLKNKE